MREEILQSWKKYFLFLFFSLFYPEKISRQFFGDILFFFFFFSPIKKLLLKNHGLDIQKNNFFFRLFIRIAGPKLPRVLLKNEVQLSWEQRMFCITALSLPPLHAPLWDGLCVVFYSFCWDSDNPKMLCLLKMFFLFLQFSVSTCWSTLWIGFVSWGDSVWRGVLQAQSDKWELGVSRLKKLFKKPSFN